jgi:ABC-type nickel/cobalt efflux system permease component RcnA
MNSPSLDALRDIHLPPPPALAAVLPEPWMAAAGAVLVLVAAMWAWRAICRRRLRAVLRELSRLAAAHRQDGDTTRFVAGLSRLLRRRALECYPEAGVAGLTGTVWLDFLDAHGGGEAFRHGAGAVLEWRPYTHQGPVDEAALVALVRRWLKANP